jgi:transcriptional regulator with XRE-family HTH domain
VKKRSFRKATLRKERELLRCYISRVENGHTVPAVETLEKFARALEVSMYQLFYGGEEPPKMKDLPNRKVDSKLFGASGRDGRMLAKFRKLLGQTDTKNQSILLLMAQKMARRKAV